MTSDDCLELVLLAETFRHIRTKLQTDTTLAWTSARGLLRIGPKHFHHQSALARLSLIVSVKLSDVVKRDLVVREQTAMQCEIVVAHKGSKWKGRERFRKEFEDTL